MSKADAMKVLIITPYLGPVYGGISAVVPEIVRALGKQQPYGQSLSIDLVTTNANDTTHLDVPLDQWIAHDHHRVRYFASWHRNDFILSGGLLRWLWQNVESYDLVHSHTLFTPLLDAAHSICQYKQVPYIMTPHGMLEPWALAYKAWKKRLYFKWVEARSLKKAAAIQALTTVEIEQIQSLGFQQTLLVPNGIHAEQFESLPSAQLFYEAYPQLKEKDCILFLGRIDPKKGLDLLAQAFAQVSKAYPNTHLIVAGPDSINFMPTARSYFAEANCLENVTFTGMVKGELKRSMLAAAQIYVAPSYSEGFSMSILEGMASSLPCVFTTHCNFHEAQAANAAQEVAADSDEIAQAILKYLCSPQQAKETGDHARQFVFDHYTWDSIARQLADSYVDLLTKSSSATAPASTATHSAIWS